MTDRFDTLVFATRTVAMVKLYDLKAALPKGQTYDFSQLHNKVVLIVNTASK